MKLMTLEQIRNATGAILQSANPAAAITSISTDSRKMSPGCLFIAIHGENHDGHHHLEAAAQAGATAAMVHANCLPHVPLLRVPDTRRAMGQLAAMIRRTLQGTVIAVAGSNGKTGTKHLIDSVLSSTKSGSISPKSFNNDIGVPLTIFDADPAEDYLILEIGTNHPGEILNLTNIAQPDVAVITSIGAEHLEFLGDINGVITENAQIIAGLQPDGLLIINGDGVVNAECRMQNAKCSELLAAVKSYPGRTITFGLGPHNDLCPQNIECDLEGVRFTLNGKPYFIPQLGRHTAVNAMAAIAVAQHLGVNDEDIFAGFSSATGPDMRLQLQTAGSITILNDAYNANPHSMMAGLQTLRDIQTDGRRIAILGDMRELGETAEKYHREIGQFAATCGLDQLICVGKESQIMAAAATAQRVNTVHFDTAAECATKISEIVQDDDLILIKASRGMKLEHVANAILAMKAEVDVSREVAARMKKVLPQPTSVGITT